ncbi:MAG: discoidin domain-containing protein [Candidatus Omnitrophica bacterium]|nr:discoidin domain-containing protein [Candidatus Omnitrophota bacterium]
MRKLYFTVLACLLGAAVAVSGCQNKQADAVSKPEVVKEEKQKEEQVKLDFVEVGEGENSVYLNVSAAEASSFDTTPDWAPEPNPMAVSDGNMLTRWSSDYSENQQWISFDLGVESVLSEVVIKWERAYASEYAILVSKDNVNWGEVYRDANAQGGATDAVFKPTKCQYVKILCVKKANEEWGISIWEVEMYGPQSYNPQATVTKEEYMSRGVDEAKKKEAEELIASMVSPVVPISEKPFQKGVVYTSWMADELSSPASDLMLTYVKESGFDTVAIMVPAYQDGTKSEVIYSNDKPNGDTPTEASVKHAIDVSHQIGMRVMVKPHVDPRTGEARVNILPSDPWFDSYRDFVLRYAKLAQDNNAEIFSIGTELEATTFDAWSARWDDIIGKVREVYKGTLTYSANWTEYKEVPFWDKLDLIGIDAYFPLSMNEKPTLEELVKAWSEKADEIEKWLIEKNLTEKGVIFTEVGYPSSEGAAKQPWAAISNIESQEEQANCLEAMFQVLSTRPWFKGYYVWQYFPQDRWSPLGFTVKGKKAEEVIKKYTKE